MYYIKQDENVKKYTVTKVMKTVANAIKDVPNATCKIKNHGAQFIDKLLKYSSRYKGLFYTTVGEMKKC